MKYLLTMLYIVVLPVLFTGCNMFDSKDIDVPEKTQEVNVKEKADEQKKSAEKIDKEADDIKKQNRHIETSIKDTEFAPDIIPSTRKIDTSVERIHQHTGDIKRKSKEITDLQKVINTKDKKISSLSNRLKNLEERLEKLKNKQNKNLMAWLTLLQVGGIIVAGLGVVAGAALKRLPLGIWVTSGGAGVATAAWLWGSYAWIFGIVLGATVLGAFGYIVWYAVERRKIIFRQVLGLKQSKMGEKILDEEGKREQPENQ